MPSTVTHEDGGGAGRSGNTLSGADELAVEFGDNETDSFGSTGGVRNDVASTCAAAAEVTLALRTVEDHLVAGVSVDGAHDTTLDGSVLVKSVGHRSEAVGGAGCCADNCIGRGEGLVVGVINDGREVIASRSGNNDLLCAGLDVSGSLCLGGIETCALENHVNFQFAPREFCSVGFCIDGDLLAVNDDGTRSNYGLGRYRT